MKIPPQGPAATESKNPAPAPASKRAEKAEATASARGAGPSSGDTKVTISPKAASKKMDADMAESEKLLEQIESGRLSPMDHERALKRVGEILSSYKSL